MKPLNTIIEGMFDVDDNLNRIGDELYFKDWMKSLGCTGNGEIWTSRSKVFLIDRRAMKTSPEQISDLDVGNEVLFKNVQIDNIKNFSATRFKISNSEIDGMNIHPIKKGYAYNHEAVFNNSTIKNAHIELEHPYHLYLYNTEFKNCTFDLPNGNIYIKLDMSLDDALEYTKNNIISIDKIPMLEKMGIKNNFDLDWGQHPNLPVINIICKDMKNYIRCSLSTSIKIDMVGGGRWMNMIRQKFK